MNRPRAAALAIAVPTVVVLLVDVGVAAVAGRAAEQVYIGIAVVLAAGSTALALLVAHRRPGNAVAPLLAWMAFLVAAVAFSDNYPLIQARRPDLLPALPGALVAVLVSGWVWLYAAVALLLLVFPDGRLPGPRRRAVAVALPVTGLAIQVVMAVSPGPYDAPYGAVGHPFGDLPEPVATAARAVLFPLLVVLLLASLVSSWLRFRRGDEVRRAQLRWLALAGLALPVTVLLSWGGLLVFGDHDLAGLGFALLYAAVPAAATIAILCHDLYDVDRALANTVAYGALTAGLLAVFALVSFGSGVLLGRDSPVLAAAVTAGAAFALAPLRARLQRRVDRRLYPVRRAALEAIDGLREATTAGRSRPEELQSTLQAALRDPSLRVGLRMPGTERFTDTDGRPLDPGPVAAPVLLRGERIGVVSSAGSSSRALLREVAVASALLVAVIRLRLQVTAALRQAESSRSRLLRVGYEERRRLERDLHDGAQQRLVSLGMALRLAQRHLGEGTVDVDALLDQSVAELGTAIGELRMIAQGLRPSCLDDGLHPALSLLAETVPLPVDLEVAADHTVPDHIALTAYYVVSEAVANAVKHAGATGIRLRIEQGDGSLRVRVCDDGNGGAAVRPGSGLSGLGDRVAAAGGSLSVVSPLGAGTVVEAMLPCAS